MPEGVYVTAGGHRFEKRREVFGARRIDYNVSTLDTNGGLFISEILDDLKGGPARHGYHEQDEWFYVVEGEYIIEIGGQTYAGADRFGARVLLGPSRGTRRALFGWSSTYRGPL